MNPDWWGLYPAVASWPGLCAELTKFIGKEVKASLSKRKGADPSLSKVFRKFLQLADDSGRSGGSCCRWSLQCSASCHAAFGNDNFAQAIICEARFQTQTMPQCVLGCLFSKGAARKENKQCLNFKCVEVKLDIEQCMLFVGVAVLAN